MIFWIYLLITILLGSCNPRSQKNKLEEPTLMPPLELGHYDGSFHVTSNEVEVTNGRGDGTPSVGLQASGGGFFLDCHSEFSVIGVEVRTEDNRRECYNFYPKHSTRDKMPKFSHQENDVYELEKLQRGLQCQIKPNKSSKPRWVLLRLQIGIDFFPKIVIYQSGKKQQGLEETQGEM